jgi:hypothetical protein
MISSRYVGFLAVVALALGMGGEARSEVIRIESAYSGDTVSRPDVAFMHKNDGINTTYSSSLYDGKKVIDFYFQTPPNNKLNQIAESSTSWNPFAAYIGGRNLTGSANSNLKFVTLDNTDLSSKNIFADLYTPTDTLLGTYNVKDYAASGTTVPITVVNGLSYKLDIRFTAVPEPSAMTLLTIATGLTGLARWQRKR